LAEGQPGIGGGKVENCSCSWSLSYGKVELRGERKFAKCTVRTAMPGQVYKPNFGAEVG